MVVVVAAGSGLVCMPGSSDSREEANRRCTLAFEGTKVRTAGLDSVANSWVGGSGAMKMRLLWTLCASDSRHRCARPAAATAGSALTDDGCVTGSLEGARGQVHRQLENRRRCFNGCMLGSVFSGTSESSQGRISPWV